MPFSTSRLMGKREKLVSRCSRPGWSDCAGRLRVTVLTQLFPPETQAGANRLGAMVEALAQEFDVTVVTLYPSYPNPEFFQEGGWVAGEDDGRTHRTCRVTTFEPHTGSFIRRGARELLMSFRLARHARTHPTDLVVATSPSFFLGPFGLLLAGWKRVPFVWDIRDVTWRYVTDHDNAGSMLRALGKTMRRLAGFIGRRTSLVVGSNPGIVAEMAELGVGPDQITHVPNGVSSELLEACEMLKPSEIRSQTRVTYAGALGYYQGLETLITVAALMPDVQFVLAGDGPERTNLEAEAKQLGVTNVVFLGYLDRADLLQLYADSDVLFASLRDLPSLNDYTIPSKPFEYAAAGKPIVYVGRGLAAEFFRSLDGPTVAPPDPETVRNAIESLLNPDRNAEAAKRSRQIVIQFLTPKIMDRLVGEIAAIVEGSARNVAPGE